MGNSNRWVMFSEVHGQVLMQGKPVAGATVIQKVLVSDDPAKNPIQQTTTDATGSFHLSIIEKKIPWLYRLLPSQPAVNQTIIIRYQDVDYVGWKHGKMDFANNTELNGQPLNFVCELTDEPDYSGTHYGICKVVGAPAPSAAE